MNENGKTKVVTGYLLPSDDRLKEMTTCQLTELRNELEIYDRQVKREILKRLQR